MWRWIRLCRALKYTPPTPTRMTTRIRKVASSRPRVPLDVDLHAVAHETLDEGALIDDGLSVNKDLPPVLCDLGGGRRGSAQKQRHHHHRQCACDAVHSA